MAEPDEAVLPAQGSAEIAYRQIRDAIISGKYAPGERLIELRLSEEYDLSRTPIREGLRRLEAEGLIEIVRHKGAVVNPFTPQDVIDLYLLRQSLEALAARQAAERHGPADLHAMDEALDQYDFLVEDESLASGERANRIEQCNNSFHQAIYDASRNRRLAHLMLSAVDPPRHMRSLPLMTTDQLRVVGLFHRMMRDAIQAEDGARAERLMVEHLAYGRDVVMDEEKSSLTPRAERSEPA